jgi:hypothetical protein
MTDRVYQQGETVPLTATFRDAAGVLADPTVVTLTVRKPDGTALTPTPTRTSTGVWTYGQSTDPTALSDVGIWWYTYRGTGTVDATEQGSFVVERVETAGSTLSVGALVTLDEAREYVFGSIADDTNDRKLMRRVNAASRIVQMYTRREMLPRTAGATRTFAYPGFGMLSLAPYDLRVVTAVVVFTDYPTTYQLTLNPGSGTALAEFKTRPVGGDEATGTYRWIEFGTYPYTKAPLWPFEGFTDFGGSYAVSVTGDWGIWATVADVPWDVKEATLIAVEDSYSNPAGSAMASSGPLGAAGLPEMSEYDSTAGGIWRALPADSRAILSRYLDDPVLIG